MKVSILDFLAFFLPRAVETTGKAPLKPPAHQDGYSMGATGEVATEASIKQQARNYQPNAADAYYNRTKRWLGRRVWDCNGMAEGYYRDRTGININTKARYNYANWCGWKSPALPDAKLRGMPQIPGVAVFSGDNVAAISHVGYLLRKTGSGPLDWDVIEARGADYGVVITPLSAHNWRWWGVMDKYFDYGDGTAIVPSPTPEKGGNDVNHATCTGNGVNLRSGPDTTYKSLGKLNTGDKLLALPDVRGWRTVAACIDGNMVVGYMSAQYVREV